MKLELIFFDAAGTLIGVRGRVGDIYARAARAHGLEIDPEDIHRAFLRAFRAQPPMAFPVGTPDGELRALEFAWWRTLVREVFAEREFPGFEAFFAELFEYFRRPEAWQVFADVAPTLVALRERGVRLAVLSNFDSRLEDLLASLGLAPFFEAIHISTRLGAEKPDPAIFHAALAHHGLDPRAVLHVGDRPDADLAGARAAGLRALLIDRAADAPTADRITRLDQLLER